MSKQQETIERVKVALTNLNAVLQECRDQDISLAMEINHPQTEFKSMNNAHKDNQVSISLHEAYKIDVLK